MLHLLERRLDGQLGRVARVHPAHEGVDQPLERLRPQVPGDELLNALLVVGRGRQHQPDRAEAGPAVGCSSVCSSVCCLSVCSLGQWVLVRLGFVVFVVVATSSTRAEKTAPGTVCSVSHTREVAFA